MINQDKKKEGILIMAGTSIGQPIDIPLRSLDALRTSDCLVFEEDRPARKALKAAGIHRDYLKYSEHNQSDTLKTIAEHLRNGDKVTYMSDQGMPTIADPGKQLLQLAYSIGAKVSVIPGPSSITAALAACPFTNDQFIYRGFLPREPAKREKAILLLKEKDEPVVILETPYRRKALLQDFLRTFGYKRKALLALDITGPQETFIFGTFADLINAPEDKKLNFVLILAPDKQSGGRTRMKNTAATKSKKHQNRKI